MRKNALKLCAAGLSAVLLLLSASCSLENKELAVKMFKNRETIGFSARFSVRRDEKNYAADWRDGMFSGNGEQGFITDGAPYADSILYEHAGLVLTGSEPEAAAENGPSAEEIKQALVGGETVSAGAAAVPTAQFHPGASLRLRAKKHLVKSYVRYTDYESGEVGESFVDTAGSWARRSFTSFADNAVFTAVSSLSGSKLDLTLSFDDIGSLPAFGMFAERDVKVRRVTDENGEYLAFLGRYPDAENDDAGGRGWITFVSVLHEGGRAERVPLEDAPACGADVSGALYGVRITDAYAVHLIAFTERLSHLGSDSHFAEAETFNCVRAAANKAARLAAPYLAADGSFDYEAALGAHTAVYGPMFGAVSLSLGKGASLESNEALIRAQQRSDRLLPAYVQKAYYAGRYAMLCSLGPAAFRSGGLWTGSFAPDRGGVYDLYAGVGLRAAALGTANISAASEAYAAFLLQQTPLWERNAENTHGFTNALQAPLTAAGVNAAAAESADGASRFWNAGTAMLLRPLYEILLAEGDREIPLPAQPKGEALRRAISLPGETLSDEEWETISQRGTLRLQEDILYPLLLKAANYWAQLVSPAYYTDQNGGVHYEPGKTALAAGETYALLPGFAPAFPQSAGQDAAETGTLCVNYAADIAACRDTLGMLLDVARRMGLETDFEPEEKEAAAEEPAEDESGNGAEAPDPTELSVYAGLLRRLPDYRSDEAGLLQPWALPAADAADEALLSALAFAWPFVGARENARLFGAGGKTLADSTASSAAGTAQLRRGMIAARLWDRAGVTEALLSAERGGARLASMLTTSRADGGAVSADYAVGYMALVQEALVQSGPDAVELLPALPESGFELGTVSGLRTLCGVTVTLMAWDLDSRFLIADLTADRDQTLTVSTPFSDQVQTVQLKAGETQTVSFSLGGDAAAGMPPGERAAQAGEDPEGETAPSGETPAAARIPASYDRFNAELFNYNGG